MYCTFHLHTLFLNGFTKNEELLLQLINVAYVGTRLYYSMIDAVKIFRNSGDRIRPWILIVVTDGDDTHTARSFANEPSNYLFVLGVDYVTLKRWKSAQFLFLWFGSSGCNFDVCPSHCEPGRECKPESPCPNEHPLRYIQLSTKL
ncbi:21357_t:CDS:2, partial [Gigaspora rosea]